MVQGDKRPILDGFFTGAAGAVIGALRMHAQGNELENSEKACLRTSLVVKFRQFKGLVARSEGFAGRPGVPPV